jgi:flagellar biosynthetic protein FliQ
VTDTAVLEIALQAIIIAAKLCAPILIVTMAVGFGISLMQAVTQIQEVTLTFVPKLVAVAVVIMLAGNWMLHEMLTFTGDLYALIPRMADAA